MVVVVVVVVVVLLGLLELLELLELMILPPLSTVARSDGVPIGTRSRVPFISFDVGLSWG